MSVSLSGKRWIIRTGADHTAETIRRLSDERGLSLRDHTPVFPDLPRIIERVRKALEKGECIGVFGDYDCDGITSVTQIVRFLRRNGSEPEIFLPHRMRDGYGIKSGHIEYFHEKNVTVLFCLDTGILAHAALSDAHKKGIDVIVLDHHTLPDVLPEAFGILHPALASPPLKPSLCTAGLTVCLVEALEQGQWQGMAEDRVLAAIGTVADVVELRGINRSIVQSGIRGWGEIREGPLAEIARWAGKGPVGSTDIAFRIAPRINAAGRMDDPHIALRALLKGGDDIDVLERLNRERQSATVEAMEEIESSMRSMTEIPSFLCMQSERFSSGIVGILAGKLTERYGRPALVAAVQNGRSVGSLRSIPAYDVTEALARHGKFLTTFGGHAQAAGCTFATESFAGLSEALNRDVEERIEREKLMPMLEVEGSLRREDINMELCEALKELEPFGCGNPEPRFLLKGVHLSNARLVGKEGLHLSASIGHIRTIGFGHHSLFPHIQGNVDIVCRLAVSEWNGRCAPQIIMDDARVTPRVCTGQGTERTLVR